MTALNAWTESIVLSAACATVHALWQQTALCSTCCCLHLAMVICDACLYIQPVMYVCSNPTLGCSASCTQNLVELRSANMVLFWWALAAEQGINIHSRARGQRTLQSKGSTCTAEQAINIHCSLRDDIAYWAASRQLRLLQLSNYSLHRPTFCLCTTGHWK